MTVVYSSQPPPRVVRAGVGTAIALGASTAVLLFSLLTLGTIWLRSRDRTPPGATTTAYPSVSADIELWVGEWAPGVKTVLSSEWNDPVWDRNQDAEWNRGLGLAGPDSLAFLSLVAFNTSDEPASLSLGEGALRIETDATGPSGAPAATLRSVDLASILRRPQVAKGSTAATLHALGADRAVVELPPGRMFRTPVAFPAATRDALARATSVARADGTTFHRRRIRRGEWAGLLHSPSVEQIRAL